MGYPIAKKRDASVLRVSSLLSAPLTIERFLEVLRGRDRAGRNRISSKAPKCLICLTTYKHAFMV